jgi:hypothetical protein
MRLRLPLITPALILAVVACNKPAPVANNVAAAAPPVAVNADARDPAGGPTGNERESTPAAASPTAAAAIPAELQGRWGLTPADCTEPLANAKGLLVINSSEMRFYESRAVPGSDVHTDAGTTSGTFHFTGEGQSWDKFESLQRKGGRLTRTEGNPTASYTYAKC